MDFKLLFLIFIIGVVIGILIANKFKKSNDMNVEDCIEYLKNKGYKVKIDIPNN